MKRLTNLSLVLLLILGTMFVISCEKDPDDPPDGTTNPQNISYTGYKEARLFTLTITETEETRTYSPKPGDTYTLTSTNTGGSPLTSSGEVYAVNNNGAVLQLKSTGATTFDLTATVTDTYLQSLSGIMSWTGTTGETAPGALTQTAGEAEPDLNLCDYYVFVDLMGSAPNQMTAVMVLNIAATQIDPLPTVQVKINNNNLSFLNSDEYEEGGEWFFEWYFYWGTAVEDGNTYSITLTVGDNVKTDNIKIVSTPAVSTTPTNFNPTQLFTYNWILTPNEDSRMQGAEYEWNTFNDWSDGVETISLLPGDRAWSIPANTLPSNWSATNSNLYFTLLEANYTITGNTAFVSNKRVEKNFEAPASPSRRAIGQRELARKLVDIVKKGK